MSLYKTGTLVGLLALSSCQCEQLFPEPVAMGVGRLSVRNLGTLVSLIVDDTKCGFKAPEVLANPTLDGETGHPGTITYHVDGCTLDLGKMHVVSKDCNGVKTSAAGQVTVTGLQKIRGQLTGNPENQVIPADAEAVHIELDVSFQDYEVRSSDAKNGLKLEGGSARFVAKPHLAASESLGVCSVASRDLTLEKIVYKDARLQVDAGDGYFEAQVPTSDFSAQIGKWGDRENDLKGKITVWDKLIDLPADGDGLDPEYKRAKFEKSFACEEDLAIPLSYRCQSLEPEIALGVARLTAASYGIIADLFDEDTVCGFKSDGQMDNQIVTGELGRPGGRVRMNLDVPCTITYPQRTAIKDNCNGVTYYAQGSVTATGFKEVEGFRSGNREKPIIPTVTRPSIVDLTLSFADFSISRSDLPYELQVQTGSLSGEVSVRLAVNTDMHVCTWKSGAAHLDNIAFDDANAVLVYEGNQFAMTINSSDIEAYNGQVAGHENEILGTITIDDKLTMLQDVSGPAPLDPNYDAETFLAADACRQDYLHAADDQDCSVYPLLGNLAARLILKTAGTVGSLINSDDDCGFEDTLGVLLWPTTVEGDSGDMGYITWDTEDCSISSGVRAVKQDCFATKTYAGGGAKVDAARTVSGERDSTLLLIPSVIPRERRAVEIVLNRVQLAEYEVYDLLENQETPEQKIVFEEAMLSGTVEPLLGENSDDRGVFDIPTPLVIFSSVAIEQAQVTLELMGLSFYIEIADVLLHGQNGFYQGQGNSIEGRITVDGNEVSIVNGELNPNYDQAYFDDSYSCTGDLVETIPPQ